jgi:hypothetical protein
MVTEASSAMKYNYEHTLLHQVTQLLNTPFLAFFGFGFSSKTTLSWLKVTTSICRNIKKTLHT